LYSESYNIEFVDDSMENRFIKNGLVDFAIGVVSYVTVDAIITQIKKLQKEGKLNRKDGEKMMHDVVKKYQTIGNKYTKDVQSRFGNLMKASIKTSPFATKEDIENLNAKIDELSMLSKKTKIKRVSKKLSRKSTARR
jgi:polyhydroxyalkanoate synthesis regulator phasin